MNRLPAFLSSVVFQLVPVLAAAGLGGIGFAGHARAALPAAWTLDAADPDPATQGWTSIETVPGSDTVPADGRIDAGANVGALRDAEGALVAWQVADQLGASSSDRPAYDLGLTADDLAALFAEGWTFTAVVRGANPPATAVEGAASGFTGWGLSAAVDPGWGIPGAFARVGFSVTKVGDRLRVAAHGGGTALLDPGSADGFHTITATAAPGSPVYEWFVDGVFQGTIDLRDSTTGGATADRVTFGADSSPRIDEISDWRQVSLAAGEAGTIPTDSEAVAREIAPHVDSLIGPGIDTATGSLIRGHELLTVEGARDLTFEIDHDSRLTALSGPLGVGWRHGFEARLIGRDGMPVVVKWDAHRRSRFSYDPDAPFSDEFFRGIDEDVRQARLFRQTPHPALPPGVWVLELEDGTTWYFGEDGRLLHVQNIIRQGIDLAYDDAGRLVTLTERYSGVAIHLVYDGSQRIHFVHDDLGRGVRLGYDARARLIRVNAPMLPEEAVAGGTFAPLPIPDGNPAGAAVEIDVPEGGFIGGIVTHALRITHSRPADLQITVVSPAGTELPIDHTPSAGATVVDRSGTRFDFSGFEGEERRGTWRLRVVDTRPGATGSIEAFQLQFVESSRAVRYAYEDAPSFPAAGRIVGAADVLDAPLLGAAYDALGRVIRISDGRPETPDATVSHGPVPGAPGQVRTVYTDPLGHPWTFVHDAGFHLISASNPLGQSVDFIVDDEGRRLARTDALGRTTTFTYNERGDVRTVTDPAGHTTTFDHDFSHLVVEITDALDRSSSFLYQDNRLTVVTDALGQTDRKTYHSNGQVATVVLSDNADIRFDLTPQGRTGRISNPTDADKEANLDYDEAGRLIRTTDYEGNESRITYTPASDVRTEIDADGNVARRDYDHRGRLIRSTDRRGFPTEFAYDGNGNVTASTNAIGERTTFAYDHDDRLVAVTNPRGAVVRYQYDAAGRRIAVTDALGRTTRTEYDAVSNVVATRDAAGVTAARITWDERDLPVRIENAHGEAVTAVYDAVGRKTESIDPLGRRTTFEYDELDRLVSVTDPLGRTGTATWMSDDVVEYLDGPGAEEFRFFYDRSNNMTEVLSYYGRRSRIEHDARNLITRTQSPAGRIVEFEHDGLGRLVESRPVETLGTQDRTRGYEYDADGRLVTVGIRLGGGGLSPRTTRTYDPAGRLSTFTNERNETIIYTYDPAGNLASLVYPDGSTVEYDYDLADRLVTVTDWAGRITRFTWDDRDRLTAILLPNGTRRDLRYDGAGNILYRADTAADGSVIVAYRYQFDSAGRLEAETVAPADPPAMPEPATYEYDLENRITSMNGDNVALDADGNVIVGPADTPLATLAWNGRGKLYRTRGYFHFYDEEDRLVGWEPRGGSLEDRVDFTVNPAGALSQILVRQGPADAVTRYVHGIGLLYEEDAATGAIRVFHYDHRGSTVALSDDDGMVVGRVAYDPYGRIAERTGQTDTVFLFHGLFGVLTSPEELVHMRFRWYSPTLRRFLSQDAHLGSLASLASLNRFAFAGGNPAMFADPEGEFFWVIGGAIAGAVINTVVTFVVDLADDGRINTPGEEYAAAAIGGAVMGGILAGTGGLGGAVLAGAAGGAAENLALAGLRGDQVDGNQLAFDTIVGGALGAAGHGAGKLVGKASTRAYGKFVGKPGKFAKFASWALEPAKVGRRRAVGSLSELVERSAKAEAGQRGMQLLARTAGALAFQELQPTLSSLATRILPGIPAAAASGANAVGDFAIHSNANRELNAGRDRAYGEYIHYDRYLDALRLADRPVPTHPNNTLTGF